MKALGVAIVLAAATAHATPRVAVTCPALDAGAVDGAVARELALDPKLADRAGELAIALECADGLHARVRIGAAARELDLGEEPPELRVKLVAVAIAELIETVETAPPRPTPMTDDDELPPRLVKKKKLHLPNMTMRAGLRLFADDRYPMALISAELEVGPVELGVSASFGEAHRFTSVPYIVAATARRRIACTSTTACLVARADAGFAGVSIYSDALGTMEEEMHSFYGDLAVGFEVQRSFKSWKGLADVELGAAHGLVVEAQSFVHLNGPFAAAGVGARW